MNDQHRISLYSISTISSRQVFSLQEASSQVVVVTKESLAVKSYKSITFIIKILTIIHKIFHCCPMLVSKHKKLELPWNCRSVSNCSFQISFDVAWSPDCVDGRCYDAEALSQVVDFLVVMAYDEQSQIKTGDCIAKANSPLKQTEAGKCLVFTN